MGFNENRALLGVLAMVLVLFGVAVFFYNQTLNQLASGSCSDSPETCPHEKVVETQNLIIAALIIVIGAVVAWIFYQMQGTKTAEPRVSLRHEAEAREPKKIDASKLDADEKKVLETLEESNGSVFQTELVGKLGYTKVKISRILDRMEQKGLLERKRRGMANLVVLK